MAQQSTSACTPTPTLPPQTNMDQPPAYSTHLTIPDLRAQIIANSTIIYPHREVTKAADSHLELIVAKAHQPTPSSANVTGKHLSTVGGPSTHAAATGPELRTVLFITLCLFDGATRRRISRC
ncbi:hypothetical protein LTR01_003751 [Friedmanniomyces endolithicus]|nr:hypothetical protein LTR01_003751 [Friedmanniomyces endolithicus]